DQKTEKVGLARLDNVDRLLKDFVATGAYSGDGWPDLNVWNEANALELTAVGMLDRLAGEADPDVAGNYEPRNVAIGADTRASHQQCVVSGLEEEAGMLSLAEGALVDQHDRTPLIAPLVSARQPLQKALDGGTTKVLFTRYYIGSHDRPLDQSA